MKKIAFFIGLIAIVLLVFFGTRYWYTKNSITVEEESEILLERINTVTKLITIEGEFSEIYDYKDYWKYDLSPFRKKALVRINGKVSVGHNLNNINIEAFPEQKHIVISNVPGPEILSVDHKISYYDITQGTFNSFSPKDYNKINDNAKELIRRKAEESILMKTAEEQGVQLLEMIRFMTEQMGWNLEIEQTNTNSPTLIPSVKPLSDSLHLN
jgi:hypothetical protein